jgi:hypothetical protein
VACLLINSEELYSPPGAPVKQRNTWATEFWNAARQRDQFNFRIDLSCYKILARFRASVKEDGDESSGLHALRDVFC